MSVLRTRAALPTDDLTVLWPNTAQRKLNLDQILVITDGTDGPLLAGALFMDGGHDVVFVAEARNIAPARRHAHVAKVLHDGIWSWLYGRGKTLALFHCSQGPYAAQLQRKGARLAAMNMLLLSLAITQPTWEEPPCAAPTGS